MQAIGHPIELKLFTYNYLILLNFIFRAGWRMTQKGDIIVKISTPIAVLFTFIKMISHFYPCNLG